MEPNPFLSPRFLFPASAHLQAPEPLIVWWEIPTGEMVGLGAFEEVAGTPRMPCRHFRSWRCQHTFADGLLVAPDWSGMVLDSFWDFAGREGWSAVEFAAVPVESPLVVQMDQQAAESQVAISCGAEWKRPVCLPHLAGSVPTTEFTSGKRAKSLRRGWHQLERYGTPSFHLRRSGLEGAKMLMFLEMLGWKRDAGTALASHPADQQFFLDLVERFSRSDDAVYFNLEIDGRPIASVLTLMSGGAGFTFKLGWDPQFERGCPGFHLMSAMQTQPMSPLDSLTFIDSCSSSGSFIERVWPLKRPYASRVYALGRQARLLASVRDGVRWMRNRWSHALGRGDEK